MKTIGNLVAYTLLAINALFACLLLSSAFSPYAHPGSSPLLSFLGLAFPIFLTINVLFLFFWLVVKYKFALFPLIVLIVCFPQICLYAPFDFTKENAPEGSLKVLSYNVMGFNGTKKHNGENEILNYIKNSNADIVCLQEYAESNNSKYLTRKDIKKALSSYPYSNASSFHKQSGGTQVALFSKYPILSSKEIHYDSQYNGSMAYQLKINNDTVLLINNHLESNKLTKEDKDTFGKMLKDRNADEVKSGSKHLIKKLGEASVIRAAQADSIAKEIKKSKHQSIIVCGDFNDTPISYTHRVISKGLDDAFENSGSGLGISYNQNRFYFRIDHILTSKNIDSFNCTVDRSIKESDHYPIATYIKIK